MKKQRKIPTSSITSGFAPSAAATAALLPGTVLAGAGDLDPAFGDIGRLAPLLDGPAWSMQAQDDGSVIVGGGRPGYYSYWGGYTLPPTDFVIRVTGDGAVDTGYVPPVFDFVQVLDVARQPDGQVVAVGRQYLAGSVDSWQLAAYRVQADGALDTTFADQGLFTLPTAAHGDRQLASSVVLEPDGRIVIAGSRDDHVIVVRLLPDGSVDTGFGIDGIAAGPENYDVSGSGSGARTSIIRAADGGYRLTASNTAGCQLIALTADGAVEVEFGADGAATPVPPGAAGASCNAVAGQADGRLLVAGQAAGQAFVTRLLADGQPDGGWSWNANGLTTATAMALGDDGAVLVGVQSATGDSAVLRLTPDGAPDAEFGDGGSTIIDMHTSYRSIPVVHDLHVAADGGVLAAGGLDADWNGFAVRLLGTAGGDAPGVIGFSNGGYASAGEGSEVVLTVRRSGGASGMVSVAYDLSREGWETALNGVDFDAGAGVLEWNDGDRSAREIRVPVRTDDEIEVPEAFGVVLTDIAGGAGLGTYAAVAEISADGHPFGQFSLQLPLDYRVEGNDVEVVVWRNFYATGVVSVNVVPEAGTAAAGTDFDASPVTLSWADGDTEPKYAYIPIVDDPTREDVETFMVTLTDASGGALIGSPSSATVRIGASDATTQSDPGGGGAIGWLSMALLAMAAFVRRLLRRCTSNPRAIAAGCREKT